MPNFCSNCGKKPTQKRLIDQRTSICTECGPKIANVEPTDEAFNNTAALPHVDDNETLNNVTFGALKAWMTATNASLVSQFEEKLVDIKQDLEDTKSKVGKLEKDLKECKKTGEESARKLETKTKTLEEDVKKQKTVGENNLKYLINLDRNDRRQNVIIFGVPEEGTHICINDEEAKTDEEKCNAIFEYIGTPINNDINSIFRLGKPVEGKVRPIKVKCRSPNVSSTILLNSKKLKDLENQTIYVKPDKTKSEVAEYQRLGKRKTELEAQYPIEAGGARRVVLEKGVLKVDNVPVDEFKSSQSLF